MEGQYLKEDEPDFSGNIEFNCKGKVNFADGKSVPINYCEEEYQISLIEPKNKTIWNKGKRFTFIVLFQLKVYNIQTIQATESVRYQTKKYSMS